MATSLLLSELPQGSLRLSTSRTLVRIDDSPESVEQTYLNITGTPEGFRWLANHLLTMAAGADREGGNNSNVVAPRDFGDQPIHLADWDAMDLACRG